MTIEVCATQARKVLATAEHPRIVETAQEVASVGDNFMRITRNGARTHHANRFRQTEIHTRSEVGVESYRSQLPPDELSMPAGQFR